MNQSIPETLKGKTYIDPRTDTGFKNLFASKDAIKDFVDGILHLKGDDRIKDLKYSFDEAIRFMVPKERKISLDAFATTGSNRFLNIEMQKADHGFFIDRTVLYKAFLIIKGKQDMENTEEFKALTKEEREGRRYEIPECISIWICDFELPQTMGNYIDEWAVYSRESLSKGCTETVFSKNKYIMVNLPRFDKTADEVKDPVDMWLYVLKHAHEGKPLPDFGNDIVNEALNRIKIENLDKTTLTEAEREMTTKEELACCLAYAKIKGLEEGRKEGRAEGLEMGRKEGLEEGRKEGLEKGRKEGLEKGRKEGLEESRKEVEKEAKLEMVDAMLGNPKFTDEDIASISGIPLDEIAKRRVQR